MSKYEVGQKVWFIEIKKFKTQPSKYDRRQDGITISETSILGISEYKLVLDTPWFTTIDNDDREGYRKDRKYYSYFDDIYAYIRTKNDLLGDGIFSHLYSTKKPTKALLNKMYYAMQNEVEKEYGFLSGGFDVVKEWIEEVNIN